jgi:hypothetical protein
LLFEPAARAVDKTGVTVALLFLVAVAVWGVDRTEKASQFHATWQKLPALSDHLEIRPAVQMSLDTSQVRDFREPSPFSRDKRVDGQS